MAFWWDMHGNVNLTVADIFNIWGDAEPNDWIPSNVFARLRDAADDNGVSVSLWDALGSMHGIYEGTW